MSSADIECIVIGAGVVGLAVARALALSGREVMILEAEPEFGTVTSARNSEVIHAGVYYPVGSLKARFCVEGKIKLYAYLEERGLPFLRCEKLIVATPSGGAAEIEKLKEVQARAAKAGVDLPLISGAEAQALEPSLNATAALHSPTTGIVDSHQLMLSYLGDAEQAGATLVTHAPVLSAQTRPGGAAGLILEIGGDEPMSLSADLVINAAGLTAQTLARKIAGLDPATIPAQHFCKGNYFSLTGRPPFERLIYPVPQQASLGLHYTRDLGGRGRFGPDVEWLDGQDTLAEAARGRFDYTVDGRRAALFADAIRAYWPDLPEDALQPDYSGVRPKIQAKGEASHDFVIQTPNQTGINGYAALYGIESPGLTSSLALADHVVSVLSP
ncbi:MAG: NAD(P)/FAD-dependent oxidoreductase [Rhodospirillaceae bacterium]